MISRTVCHQKYERNPVFSKFAILLSENFSERDTFVADVAEAYGRVC